MEIKYYTAQQLKNELSKNDLWNSKHCPITRHRAISIIMNPRTLPSDPVLIVGYLKGEVSGYIALVPDVLYSGGESVRLGWLGSWWSDPDPSNSMMAVLLLRKAYELYNGFVAGFSAAERAEQLIKSSNRFRDFRVAVGYQYIFRFNLGFWIPRKYPKIRLLNGIFRFSDGLLNLVQNTRVRLWKSSNKIDRSLSIEYLTQIYDSDTIEFIKQHNYSQLTRRNHEDINAMIKYPTSLATVLEDKNKSKYFFSNKSHRFLYLLYKILDSSQKIIAIVMICVDGDHLTIPFVFNRKNTEKIVLTSVLHHLVDMNIDMLTTYHTGLNEQIRLLKVPYIYKKNRNRNSLISEKIDPKPYIDPFMQDGDGA
ncbi:MAG: hypothetical protein KAT31_01565 [Bacteroidales bacterium]|nr:hypothetical protein [Bacteroidales bacterium]